ncbi:MAG: stage II sporulation protein M, partial [Haloferacaceae archaeon]
GGAAAVAGPLAGLVGGAAVLLGVAAVELAVAFAGAAVVVDGVGAVPALRRGAGLATERPGAFLLYGGVAAAVLVGTGIVGSVLAAAGAPRLLGVVTALLVVPGLDGVRVALYAEREPGALAAPTHGIRIRVTAALRNGLAAVVRFVRDHPGANGGSAAVLTAGAALGWLAVAPYRLSLSPEAGEMGAAFGAVPVGPFLNIAANNWLVAAGTGYGGLALGLPAATALLFNGALVGVVAGAVDATVVAALVVPHGVVELPAIVVAGGLGLHLGRVGTAALRGRRDAAAVGAALGEALRVLVGLGVVLVVASGIETVVTPRIAAAVLG